MTVLRIYSDGGCRGNQSNENTGGWGTVLEFGPHIKELKGGAVNTTNNVMEMTALLEGFKAIKKEGQVIEVFSDSSYLMNCFREKWYINWRKNGWKTSKKEPVEHKEIWEELLTYLDRHDIRFYRVKGHVNLNSKAVNFNKLYDKFTEWNGKGFTYEDFLHVTEMNNRCDELANEAMDEI